MKDHCFYCWNDAKYLEEPGMVMVCKEHAAPGAMLLFKRNGS